MKELSSEQLAEWAAFLRLEPDADQRSDLLQAQLLTLTANLNRGKNDEPYDVLDFMPWQEKPKKEESKEPSKDESAALMAAFGKR